MPICLWRGSDQHRNWRRVRPVGVVGLSLLAVLAIATQLSGCKDTREAAAPASTFADVPSTHPFHADILKLAAKRITLGCTAEAYCPDDPVTQGQMALFMERLQHPLDQSSDPGALLTHARMAELIAKAKGQTNLDANTPPQTFCDVPTSHPLFKVIDYHANTLKAWPGCGAISGNQRGGVAECNANCADPPRKFCPDCPVTRGEVAYIFVRAFNL